MSAAVATAPAGVGRVYAGPRVLGLGEVAMVLARAVPTLPVVTAAALAAALLQAGYQVIQDPALVDEEA